MNTDSKQKETHSYYPTSLQKPPGFQTGHLFCFASQRLLNRLAWLPVSGCWSRHTGQMIARWPTRCARWVHHVTMHSKWKASDGILKKVVLVWSWFFWKWPNVASFLWFWMLINKCLWLFMLTGDFFWGGSALQKKSGCFWLFPIAGSSANCIWLLVASRKPSYSTPNKTFNITESQAILGCFSAWLFHSSFWSSHMLALQLPSRSVHFDRLQAHGAGLFLPSTFWGSHMATDGRCWIQWPWVKTPTVPWRTPKQTFQKDYE